MLFGVIFGIIFEIAFWVVIGCVIFRAVNNSKNRRQSTNSLPPFQNTISNANEDKNENIEQKQKSYTYCAYCGSKVDVDAKKCSSCGAKIDK